MADELVRSILLALIALGMFAVSIIVLFPGINSCRLVRIADAPSIHYPPPK